MKKINCIKKDHLILFLAYLNKKELIESSMILGNKKFSLITMQEDMEILTELFAFFAEMDCDILEYSMIASINQDEDDNFLTTMKFQIIRFEN